MKRRVFLGFPFAALSMAIEARAGEAERPPKGFKVSSGANRYEEELLIMGGRFDCKVSGKDTNGALCIYDTIREAKGGPALHRHHYQDEWFYAVRGEFTVKVGDETIRLRPGDSAFGPRKIPHTFAKTNEGEGQLLVLFQPAGSMEDFFHELSKYGKGVPRNQETALKDLWEKHGMEILGPPLAI